MHDLVVWKAIVERLKAVGSKHVISIEHDSPFRLGARGRGQECGGVGRDSVQEGGRS